MHEAAASGLESHALAWNLHQSDSVHPSTPLSAVAGASLSVLHILFHTTIIDPSLTAVCCLSTRSTCIFRSHLPLLIFRLRARRPQTRTYTHTQQRALSVVTASPNLQSVTARAHSHIPHLDSLRPSRLPLVFTYKSSNSVHTPSRVLFRLLDRASDTHTITLFIRQSTSGQTKQSALRTLHLSAAIYDKDSALSRQLALATSKERISL